MPINRQRWNKPGGASGAGGDVVGPASSTDNALARWDGVTGKLLQDGLMTESDAGVVSGATQLNVDNLRLDGNTISSTDANGNVILDPNGTGQVQVSGNGSAALPILNISSTAGTGFYARGASLVNVATNTAGFVEFDGPGGQNAVILKSDSQFAWQPGVIGTGSNDAGLKRVAAGIVGATDGGSGAAWFFSVSKKALAADFTNATATMANLTGLTVTLLTGRKYTFRMVAFFADSVAADGAIFDFDGGTATATDFRCRGTITDAALLSAATTTAIATDFTAAAPTGAAVFEASGSFEVNAAGTFIPRAAQASHTTGTLTVNRGSFLWIEDTNYA